MGVVGSGRTSVAGEALTDEDRWPWLDRVVGELAARDVVVLACSALRRAYRDVRSVFLDLDQADATERARARAGHYVGPEWSELSSRHSSARRPTMATELTERRDSRPSSRTRSRWTRTMCQSVRILEGNR